MTRRPRGSTLFPDTPLCRSVRGWSLLAGMLLFSATGLTWSQWAGANVDKMRSAFNWLTPQVNTQLDGAMMAHDPHAEHHAHHPAASEPVTLVLPTQFDDAMNLAQAAGLTADTLEIRPPRAADKAWPVTEIDRSWPTRVAAVAIAGHRLPVIDPPPLGRASCRDRVLSSVGTATKQKSS